MPAAFNPVDASDGEVVIDVKDLVKEYGDLRAVDRVSFQIRRGEMVGFLGVNGAGKSTSMRIITSYIPATRGSVRVCGYDVFYDSRETRRRIGYMPEVVPLYRDMRILEYMTYRAKLKDVPRRERKRHVWACMQRTEVDDRAAQIIGTLSRGYRQRVGLSDALLGEPEILILDEPTAGLDPRQKVAFRRLIESLAGEKTVLMSTHLLFELEDLKSRIVLIHRGRIVPQQRIRSLSERNEMYVSLRGSVDDGRRLLRKIEGVTSARHLPNEDPAGLADEQHFRLNVAPAAEGRGPDVRERIARAVAESGMPLLELSVRRPSLEEVFVRITQHEDR